MSKQIDNGYDGTQGLPLNPKRSNPWADPTNAIKLLNIPKFGCCDDYIPGFEWAVESSGASVEFTHTNAGGDSKYFKWVVRDESGNEAFGALNVASPGAGVAIDTSGLNPDDDWCISFFSEADPASTNIHVCEDCRCQVAFNITVKCPKGDPTGSTNFHLP